LRRHCGAEQPYDRDADSEPASLNARIERVGLDHRIEAVLRCPNDLADNGGRLENVVQAVQCLLLALVE
jgi:hypothetical protein